MTLQQIKYAITIYETGQFSRASEKLFVTQPSLTRAIMELEKEIGENIFIRTRRGVTVTEKGEDFIAYARQVYAQYEILSEKFIDQKSAKKKFGVSCQHYSFAVKAFTETIKQFDGAEYEFAVREEKTSEVIHDISTMRSEIGIIYMNKYNEKFITRQLEEHDIIFTELMTCDPYVFMCTDNPLINREFVTFEDLQDYTCLIFEQGDSDPYFYAEELLPLHEHSRIVKTRDKLTMLTILADMNGYTMCTGMIYDKLNGKEFASVPFRFENEEDADFKIRIGYITKKNYVHTETGKIFMENVRKNI